ncbi:MAG: S8 family serine peptidase [Candidatus Zixiibacteriota bacterium]
MKKFSTKFLPILLIGLLLIFQPVISGSEANNNQSSAGLKKRVTLSKPVSVSLSPLSEIVRVIIKFQEDSDIRFQGKQFNSSSLYSTTTLNDICKPYINNRLHNLINKSHKHIQQQKEIYEKKSGHQLANLSLYYRLDITNPIEAKLIVNQLNQLDIVEIAYAEPKSFPAGDIAPPTSDYTPEQTYLLSAPDGVDIDYAHAMTGGDGAGVKIIDIEHEWNESHEDLEKAVGGTLNGGNSINATHGTAVIGELIAGNNGYGITGVCPGADIGMASSAINGTIEAIMMAIDTLQEGDIIIIELNAPGPRYDFQVRSDQKGYVCLEYWQDRFDALQYAWAKGIIVVEAAGNGWEDLDSYIYENRFDTTFRNSHAIMVGAGAPPSGNFGVLNSKIELSNYGERVNLQGDGQEVFTTGYGTYWDGDGDPNQYYIANFNGTSSAVPIVAGALACLQGYYIETFGVPMGANYARDILIATGSPQQGDSTGNHIGPKPNLAAAIPAVVSPPSLFLSPSLLDTLMDNGTVSTSQFYLHNRSPGYSIDFNVFVNQDIEGQSEPDWISIVPSSGTVAPEDSFLIEISLDASDIESNDYGYKALTEISWGHSGNTLDSSLFFLVFLEVPCSPDTTFSALSSNDTGGPEFQWIDIVDEDNLIPPGTFYLTDGDPLDDGTAGPYTLPFDFPFFDSTYNKLYIGVNGAVSFKDGNVNIDGLYDTISIPGDDFRTFVPVFWNDFVMGTLHSGNGNIYRYVPPTGDSIIIEWYHLGNYGALNDTMTAFEVIITENGSITMQYLDVGEMNLKYTALVGVDGQHCRGLSYFDQGDPVEHTIEDSTVIKFIQIIPQPIYAGDCNGDGVINILDITFLISYLYKSGPTPNPLIAADPNCTISINILDITYLIAYLYKGGPVPCTYMP